MNRPIEYATPSSKPGMAISVRWGVAANIVMLAYGLSYLQYATGQVFTNFTGLGAILLALIAFVLVFCAAIGDIFRMKRFTAGIIAIILGTTPFAMFLIEFEIIAHFKKFRFIPM